MLPQELAAIDFGEQRATVKRIDDDEVRSVVAGALGRAQQEVSREVDAGDTQTGTARHLEVHDGKGDWNAGSTLHHLVEKAVARVVVMFAVADETLLVV